MLINEKGHDLGTLHTWKYNWLDRLDKYTLPEVKGIKFGNGSVDSVRNFISKCRSLKRHGTTFLFVWLQCSWQLPGKILGLLFWCQSNYRGLSCYPSYSLSVFNPTVLYPFYFHPCVSKAIPPWHSPPTRTFHVLLFHFGAQGVSLSEVTFLL